MVANQIATESTVTAANNRADRSQRIVESMSAAHLNMRQAQLAGRAIRLARTAAEVQKGTCGTARLRGSRGQGTGYRPDHPRRSPRPGNALHRIKELTRQTTPPDEGTREGAGRSARADRQAVGDLRGMDQGFAAELASPALARLAIALTSKSCCIRPTAKRERAYALRLALGVTGEADDRREGSPRPRERSSRSEPRRGTRWRTRNFAGGIDALESIVKRFLAANDDVVKTEDLKTDILANRTVKVVTEAGTI